MPPSTHSSSHAEITEADCLNRSLKTVFSDEYLDIYEVTYAYTTLPSGFFVNTTLFGKLVFGEGFEAELSNLELVPAEISELAARAKAKLEYVIGEAKGIRETLQSVDAISAKWELLAGALDEKICILEMCLIGLPFEAEKAGLPHGLSEAEAIRLTTEIEKRDALAFHGTVRGNARELRSSVLRCKEAIKNGSGQLTDSEKQELKSLCSVLPEWNEFVLTNTPDAVSENPVTALERLIPRDDYLNVFAAVFRIYGIEKPIREDERSSIYDGEDALYIPIGEKYDYLSVNRILGLVAHEIETHYLSAENNSKTLGFRAADNIFRDEGMAIIMENVLAGNDIDRIPISENMIYALYGEILPGKEYRRFLELYFKSQGRVGAEEKFRRTKRNYSVYGKGTQHKDTTYSRWVDQVRNFIRNGGNLRDLYRGKVGINDLDKLEDSSNLKYPLGIALLLRYYLLGGEASGERAFLDLLCRKYPFIRNIGEMDIDTKMEVLQIVEILREPEKREAR